MPRRAASTAPAKDPNGRTVAGGAQRVLFDSAFGSASCGLLSTASLLQRVCRRAARAGRRPRRTARRFMREPEKGQRLDAGYPASAPERANEIGSNLTRTAKRNRQARRHEKNRLKFAKL